MDSQQIKTIGHFLANYESDLLFLLTFQKNKKKEISDEEYVENKKGTFYKFLIDFSVFKNIRKGETRRVLKLTKEWIKKSNKNKNNVDEFAIELSKQGLTQENHIMKSLASKILLLNNPYEIFPIDRNAKKSLGYKGNNYAEYLALVKSYKKDNETEINKCLKRISNYTSVLEKEFVNEFQDINVIRKNRFVDKLLWMR